MHEVGDQPFEQHGITGDGPWPKVLLDRHVVLVGQTDGSEQHGLGHLIEPHRHAPAQATVAACEHEQSLDQAFAALIGDQQMLAEPAQLRRCFRVSHSDLDQRALDREWGTQFV